MTLCRINFWLKSKIIDLFNPYREIVVVYRKNQHDRLWFVCNVNVIVVVVNKDNNVKKILKKTKN